MLPPSPINLLVYCGSRSGTDARFRSVAENLADRMAEAGMTLIYGGGGIGIMGAVARRLIEHNGTVVGIIPEFLNSTEVALPWCTELIEVHSMHERKMKMLERCHAILALPGGFGTMDELFEAITWRQLGLHNKPIGLLNVDGFYDHLAKQIDVMHHEDLISKESRGHVRIGTSLDELLPWLESSASVLPPDPLLPRWT